MEKQRFFVGAVELLLGGMGMERASGANLSAVEASPFLYIHC